MVFYAGRSFPRELSLYVFFTLYFFDTTSCNYCRLIPVKITEGWVFFMVLCCICNYSCRDVFLLSVISHEDANTS